MSVFIITFADDSVIVRFLGHDLLSLKHLLLNVSKTKELLIDFLIFSEVVSL